MDFELTEEQERIPETARAFTESEIVDSHTRLGDRRRRPRRRAFTKSETVDSHTRLRW